MGAIRCVEVSAMKGTNLDQLWIRFCQAEVLDLKAIQTAEASGLVVKPSRPGTGRGHRSWCSADFRLVIFSWRFGWGRVVH